MSGPWISLGTQVPEVGQTVLLFWPVPDMAPIVRLGSLLYKNFYPEQPDYHLTWKLDLDYGDAGFWVFTNRDDEQPTHWMPILPLESVK